LRISLLKVTRELGLASFWVTPVYILTAIVSRLLRILTGRQLGLIALPSRFGHLALEPELYLAKHNGQKSKKQFTLALYPKDGSSQELINEWRSIFGYSPQFLNRCLYLMETTTGKRKFLQNLVDSSIPEELNALDFAPQVLFNRDLASNIEDGYNISSLESKQKIILLAVRDNAYDLHLNFHTSGNHAQFRNSEIKEYVKGIETLIKDSFTVIRLGKASKELSGFKDSKYLDLSQLSERQSDTLQFQFAKLCSAVVATDTGAINIGLMFRKPIYCLNFASLANGFRSHYFKLLMLKKMRDSRTGETLSLNEMFERGFYKFIDQSDFLDNNIVLEDNSEIEIRDFMEEVIDHLDGKWSPVEESLRLRREFTRLSEKHGVPIPTVDFPNSWARKSTHLL
jgi:putative glycosyltransferase (TIGR04372 family)